MKQEEISQMFEELGVTPAEADFSPFEKVDDLFEQPRSNYVIRYSTNSNPFTESSSDAKLA